RAGLDVEQIVAWRAIGPAQLGTSPTGFQRGLSDDEMRGHAELATRVGGMIPDLFDERPDVVRQPVEGRARRPRSGNLRRFGRALFRRRGTSYGRICRPADHVGEIEIGPSVRSHTG